MSERRQRGFILHPTYRIEGGRPVVHLYGRLEGGGGFLLRDRRPVPHFYVRAVDAEAAAGQGARPLAATERLTMEGEPVARVELAVPPDAPRLRDRLLEAGIPCYEADVRFAMRYLIDRGIRGALAMTGAAHREDGLAVFDDPGVAPADFSPELSVLSFDIETDPRGRRLLSIALTGCGASEVLLYTPEGWEVPPGATPFASERQLLEGFCRRVRELDPDVLTGWNVVDFDLAVLARLAEGLGMPLALGRGSAPAVRLRRQRGGAARLAAAVPGRVVLDGIALVRGAFIRLDDYSLDAVAQEVLGEGKLLGGPGRAEEILHWFKRDRRRLVDYNLVDARLVLDILQRLELVELAVERSRLTGLPPDRVASSIAAFDFLYLSRLGRRGVVAPIVGAVRPGGGEAIAGGAVLAPRPGLYENVLVFDFKSLYPSLIRTFQIDPLGYLAEPAPGEDPIVAPNGAAFRRQPGILPQLLDELMPRREAARRAGDEVASQAIKILMNSFYGVLATPACRFHNPRLANAITGFGRELLRWCQHRLEELGHAVLYGDTDSLFVKSGEEEPQAAWRQGGELVERLNGELAEHIARRWRVESRLELELETLYLRLLLPAARQHAGGASKRYAGLVEEDGVRRVVFTGMEQVRRDWTELAKEVQRELYARLFFERPLEDYLRRVVVQLRAGELDDKLIYRKALRKPPEEYTSTTPPHVAAARRQRKPQRRGVVAYVITTAGPEPAAEHASPLDYEHYVEKQLQPVAEPVLELLGIEFRKAIGDDRQLSLF